MLFFLVLFEVVFQEIISLSREKSLKEKALELKALKGYCYCIKSFDTPELNNFFITTCIIVVLII